MTNENAENLINYIYYSGHSMPSTIQLSNEAKALLGSFGTKEDTYEDIVIRVCKLATKAQLGEFLLASDGTVSLAEARKMING